MPVFLIYTGLLDVIAKRPGQKKRHFPMYHSSTQRSRLVGVLGSLTAGGRVAYA
jgi:hypothetical protein